MKDHFFRYPKIAISFLLVAIFLTFVLESLAKAEEVVNLYTSRHYESDSRLYALFEVQTGIKVNVTSAKGGALIEKIQQEGELTPGDVFITSDVGNLWRAESKDLFLPISSSILDNAISDNLRSPNGTWYGLAKRARVIYYHPARVTDEELKDLTYLSLGDAKWKGRVVIRKKNNIYNQSLVSYMIKKHGEKKAKKWVKSLVENFARKPQGNDRAQIMAVASGEADLAIANTYYIGLMLSGAKGPEQMQAAQQVKLHYPPEVHINISGGGVLKHSKNKDNAITFLEFLVSKEAQEHNIKNSHEFSILPDVSPTSEIARFGTFTEDTQPVFYNGKFNELAIKYMDSAGW